MIIFNDSISKFCQCSIRGFCRGISMFFRICLSKKKKIAEVIKFLRILKKYLSKNKIHFCLEKKSNVSLNKKVIFDFHANFKLDFITHIIYCITTAQVSVFSFHAFFVLLYHTEHRNNVNPSLFIQLAIVQQQNDWKKKPGVSKSGPWICNWAN